MIFHILHNRRIAKRLMISVVLFSTLITILTSAYQLYGNYQRDVDGIQHRLNEIHDVHLENIAARLWTSDSKELLNNLSSILNLPDIQYLLVTENGKPVAEAGEKHTVNVISREYPITHVFRNEVLTIGQLTVQATLDGVYQHLIDQIMAILISNAIKTFLVTGFILYLFHYLVTRHLETLARFSERLNIHSLNEKLVLHRRRNELNKPDELDIVTKAFTTMQANLSESISSLQDSELQVRLLLDSTAEAIYGIDTNGYCTFVNVACLHMLGYDSATELLGKPIHSMLHLSVALDDRHLEASSPLTFDMTQVHHHESLTLQRKDSSRFVAEHWSHPILKEGVCVGAVVTFIDISKRKEAEWALRDSEEHYRRLIETTTAIPWELDVKTGNFTYVGPQAAEVLGYPVEDWYQHNFWESHIYEEDRERAIAYCKSMTLHGQDHEFEYRMVTKDNNLLWIYDTVKVIKENELPIRLTGFMFNVTSRKDTEKELELYRSHLEDLVHQRTQELEMTNKELQSFSYSIAHDLRAPLRSITSFSQIVQMEAGKKLSRAENDALRRVVVAAKKMTELIDDILDLARISSSELRPEEVSLTDIAQKITRNYDQYQRGQHQVHWLIKEGLYVNVDPVLAEQLISNLFDNAYKYSATREPATIELGMITQDSQPVYFVRDNGVGFDMTYASKLFQPFERLHSPSDFPGSGVGLATAHRIVERHGGKIWATSEINKGACFYFTFNTAAPHHAQSVSATGTD